MSKEKGGTYPRNEQETPNTIYKIKKYKTQGRYCKTKDLLFAVHMQICKVNNHVSEQMETDFRFSDNFLGFLDLIFVLAHVNRSTRTHVSTTQQQLTHRVLDEASLL